MKEEPGRDTMEADNLGSSEPNERPSRVISSVTVVVPCLRHSTTSGSLRSSPEGPLREDEVRKGRSDERSDRPTEPQTTGGRTE